MSESLNQVQVLISLEEFLVLDQMRFESIHISLLDACNDLIIGEECLLVVRVWENLTIGDISHKELSNNLKLKDLNTEGFSSDFRTLSEGLNQSSLSFRVLKLNSFNSSEIVKISSILIIRSLFRESSLNQKASCLFIEVLMQVWTQYDVHDSGLPDLVMLKTAVLVDFEHKWSNFG